MEEVDFGSVPYTAWLEEQVRTLYSLKIVAISMQMRDADGKTYTCYWNVSADDRAIMMDALKHDELWDFIQENREMILEMLEDGGGDEESNTES